MKSINFTIILVSVILLSACGTTNKTYQGAIYPISSNPTICFQEDSIPKQCTAFAHLIFTTKANLRGAEITANIKAEAMEKGANVVLIGLARVAEDVENDENSVSYYGPEYTYEFSTTWLGWKFGFDQWNEGGELMNFGAKAMRDQEMEFPQAMMIQAVFLRCTDK